MTNQDSQTTATNAISNNTTANSTPTQNQQPNNTRSFDGNRFQRPGGFRGNNDRFPRPDGRSGSVGQPNRPGNRFDRRRPGGNRPNNRNKEDANSLESQVILVRRITRVVKGGKRMRFSALVVSGDRAGKIGFGLKKGLDFQDAVAKATKKAQDSAIKIKLNEVSSIDFPIQEKYKSCEIMLKPAKSGTGVIAGGFLRPVLELAGIKNIYSKIIGSRNKISGVQTALRTLQKFEAK